MISFYATNLVSQATITASTENALFPATNIQHDFRTKVFRSTTNSDNILFDLGETSEIDSVILVDNPRDGFGITGATLQLNGSSDFTTPAFSQALSISTIHGLAFAEFATQEYRYARLVLTSTAGYCELSKVFLGKKIEFASGTGIELGWKYQDDELSITKKNSYGQRFIDVKTRQRKFAWNLSSLNKDELDQVFEIYDLCGETKPFYFRMTSTEIINDRNRFGGMYYLTAIPSITNKSFGLYDLSMSLEEAM